MTTITSERPSQPEQVVPQGIAYEVLRRSDGTIALGLNVGLLPFVPASSVMKLARGRGGDIALLLRNGDCSASAVLLGLPKDVAQHLVSRKVVWLFEFGPAGVAARHEIALETS